VIVCKRKHGLAYNKIIVLLFRNKRTMNKYNSLAWGNKSKTDVLTYDIRLNVCDKFNAISALISQIKAAIVNLQC